MFVELGGLLPYVSFAILFVACVNKIRVGTLKTYKKSPNSVLEQIIL